MGLCVEAGLRECLPGPILKGWAPLILSLEVRAERIGSKSYPSIGSSYQKQAGEPKLWRGIGEGLKLDFIQWRMGHGTNLEGAFVQRGTCLIEDWSKRIEKKKWRGHVLKKGGTGLVLLNARWPHFLHLFQWFPTFLGLGIQFLLWQPVGIALRPEVMSLSDRACRNHVCGLPYVVTKCNRCSHLLAFIWDKQQRNIQK